MGISYSTDDRVKLLHIIVTRENLSLQNYFVSQSLKFQINSEYLFSINLVLISNKLIVSQL